ncbi:hypothetical protein [Methanoregula sp.]|uniref:hypothetical protein n=1 Tax=Methanoregula sp. TaxID=2052170 RepID=UPI003C76876A
MQVSDILELVAILSELTVAVVAIFIATRKNRTYGWFIALTFTLFVIFDLVRIFTLDMSADLHALIFLVACLSMVYAVWLIERAQ